MEEAKEKARALFCIAEAIAIQDGKIKRSLAVEEEELAKAVVAASIKH
jgi:hypothetical protein